MSATHPIASLETALHHAGVAPEHQQLMPALYAVAIAAVTIVVSLLMTGLPH